VGVMGAVGSWRVGAPAACAELPVGVWAWWVRVSRPVGTAGITRMEVSRVTLRPTARVGARRTVVHGGSGGVEGMSVEKSRCPGAGAKQGCWRCTMAVGW
jgi:hypothetical protein